MESEHLAPLISDPVGYVKPKPRYKLAIFLALIAAAGSYFSYNQGFDDGIDSSMFTVQLMTQKVLPSTVSAQHFKEMVHKIQAFRRGDLRIEDLTGTLPAK